MAKVNIGFMDGFFGKLGTAVGGFWKGIPYMRAKPRYTRNPNTEGQVIQRAKFKMVIDFVTSFRDLLEKTYASQAIRQTGSNAASKAIMDNGVTGTYPVLTLDYPNIVMAKGGKSNDLVASASSVNPGEIKYSWNYDADLQGSSAKGDDHAVLIGYCESLDRPVWQLAGPNRSLMTANLTVNAMSGLDVHTWLTFISKDGKKVYTSVYTGKVSVQ